jgi:hypothetical protein
LRFGLTHRAAFGGALTARELLVRGQSGLLLPLLFLFYSTAA